MEYRELYKIIADPTAFYEEDWTGVNNQLQGSIVTIDDGTTWRDGERSLTVKVTLIPEHAHRYRLPGLILMHSNLVPLIFQESI